MELLRFRSIHLRHHEIRSLSVAIDAIMHTHVVMTAMEDHQLALPRGWQAVNMALAGTVPGPFSFP